MFIVAGDAICGAKKNGRVISIADMTAAAHNEHRLFGDEPDDDINFISD